MKKFKKAIALALSAVLVYGAAVLPVSAETAQRETFKETNFETNCGYQVKASGDFYVGDGVFLVKNNNGIIKDPVYADDGETIKGYTTESVSIVPDPAAQYPGDKAFKFRRGDKEISSDTNIFAYTPGSGVVVWEFDVMFDQAFHNMQVLMQTSDWKEMRVMGSANSNGTMNILDKPSGTLKTTASLNEWHHIRVVADFSETKKVDDKEVLDFDKNNITVWFDDCLIHDHESAKSFNSGLVDGQTLKTAVFKLNTVTGTHNVYVDNYRMYSVSDTDDTSFEIKSADDYEDNSFMNGTDFKFWADSLIGSDLAYNPLNKVVWYLDGEKKETSIKYPFSFECSPKVAGKHVVSCEAYTDNDTDPFDYKEVSFFVEPKFREEVVMNEDFNTYTDGTLEWTDKTDGGTWRITNVTNKETIVGVNVDESHGKSLYLGATENRRLDGNVKEYITEGTVKVSGEIYLEGDIGPNNTMFGLKLAKDTSGLNMHGKKIILDRQKGTELCTLSDGQWYKIDYIVTIKGGQAYYTVYLDGRQLTNDAYVQGTDASRFTGAIFFNFVNTALGKIYVDNLSISKIEYYDNTGFWCSDKQVSTLNEMAGSVLTAKTAVVSPNENQQYMAVYDKTTNQLKAIEVGTYDETTKMYTVSCDLSNMENVKVKVFVWDSMHPNLETPEEIE